MTMIDLMDVDDEVVEQQLSEELSEWRHEYGGGGYSEEAGLLQRQQELGGGSGGPLGEGAPDLWRVVIVLDTNYLIAHLRFVATLLPLLSPETPLMIPFTVLRELDNLKTTARRRDMPAVPSESADGEGELPRGVIVEERYSLSSLARSAIDFLYRAFAAEAPALVGETVNEESRARGNDDRILDCCLSTLELHAPKVLLLSNDKNLCVKAMVHGIRTVSKFSGSAEKFVSDVLWAMCEEDQAGDCDGDEGGGGDNNHDDGDAGNDGGDCGNQKEAECDWSLHRDNGGRRQIYAHAIEERGKGRRKSFSDIVEETERRNSRASAAQKNGIVASRAEGGTAPMDLDVAQPGIKTPLPRVNSVGQITPPSRRRSNASTNSRNMCEEPPFIAVAREMMSMLAPSLRPSIAWHLKSNNIPLPTRPPKIATDAEHMLHIIESHWSAVFASVYARDLNCRDIGALRLVVKEVVRFTDDGLGAVTLSNVKQMLEIVGRGLWRVCGTAGFAEDEKRALAYVDKWKREM